jgi:two-component sensor histidine kinase
VIRTLTKNSANFKALLFIFAIAIVGGTFWYTHQLVNTLKEKATDFLYFRVKLFESNINNPDTDIDVGFFFNEIIQNADYPVIWTDANKNPQSWINISQVLDTTRSLSVNDSLLLRSILNTMESENKPISINYQGTVLGYYYYGFPPEVQKIKNLPVYTFLSGSIFILLGYLGFAYIKRSEQKSIWVGMAKETAHQLGTPLSSLAGWLELIQVDDSQKNKAIQEMNNDLNRLKKIANRFSKIGSVPSLKRTNVCELIQNVTTYFQKRLPHLGKKISIKFKPPGDIFVMLNRDLFEWVLENLIKNAIDAIDNKNGEITISIQRNLYPNIITIDVCDNGKGVATQNKTSIFKPGFSTKKRGWGLGLSLAKRIVEDYHQGKLFLAESKTNNGSIFRINLKML